MHLSRSRRQRWGPDPGAGRGLAIKRQERAATKPLPLVGDDGIGEITAGLQLQQPHLHSGPIEADVAGLHQGPDRGGDLSHREGVHAMPTPEFIRWRGPQPDLPAAGH